MSCRWLLLIFVLMLAGCGEDRPAASPQTLRVWTRAETELTVPRLAAPLAPLGAQAPSRVISLIPSMTELVCALGMEDRLIGRSHWCDAPGSVRALPDLGSLQDFSAERIADLKPDLVLLFDCLPELRSVLQDRFTIRCATPATESEAAVFEGMRAAGRALHAEARVEPLIAQLERELEIVRAEFAQRPHPAVLVVLDRAPPMSACPGSFVDHLLRVAGARNVVTTPPAQRPWCALSLETILDLAPEVVLDLSMSDGSAQSLRQAEEFWSRLPSLPAVRNRRVHLVAAGALVRPGPRIALAARLLARIVHDSP